MNDPPSKRSSETDDVRMKGFRQRTTVETAQRWLDQHSRQLDSEPVPLAQAAGRVLSDDVVSRVDVPGFRRAMMDGYAVHAADTSAASAYQPVPFNVVGQSLPGQPYQGSFSSGQAVRIMTGAPLPADADAVLPVEFTETTSHGMQALAEVPPEKHVGRIAEDVRAGSVVLSAGRRLRPQDLGVLSSIGVARCNVVRSPRVRIVITGNELLPAGSTPEGYRIVDANSPMLAALVLRDGGRPICRDIVPDDPEAILAALRDDADIVLVSGGSSVGQEDHAPQLVREYGSLPIHGVAMRPSSPSGMGQIDNRPVLLLPGNPVSCLCAYDFFGGRAIRQLSGLPAAWPYLSIRRCLVRKLVSKIGRLDYARVIVRDSGVEPVAIGGASVLSSTTRADGFVVVGEDSEGHPEGAEVEVWLYDAG